MALACCQAAEQSPSKTTSSAQTVRQRPSAAAIACLGCAGPRGMPGPMGMGPMGPFMMPGPGFMGMPGMGMGPMMDPGMGMFPGMRNGIMGPRPPPPRPPAGPPPSSRCIISEVSCSYQTAASDLCAVQLQSVSYTPLCACATASWGPAPHPCVPLLAHHPAPDAPAPCAAAAWCQLGCIAQNQLLRCPARRGLPPALRACAMPAPAQGGSCWSDTV